MTVTVKERSKRLWPLLLSLKDLVLKPTWQAFKRDGEEKKHPLLMIIFFHQRNASAFLIVVVTRKMKQVFLSL